MLWRGGEERFETGRQCGPELLEIGNPNWWVPCYLKLCLAIGVGSYAAIAAKDNIIDIETLKNVLDGLICGR